jgi:hypothetical protein
LADEAVSRAVAAGLSVRDAVGDTHYSADWFTKWLARLGLIWHCTLYLKTSVETRRVTRVNRRASGQTSLEHFWVSQGHDEVNTRLYKRYQCFRYRSFAKVY